MDSNLSKCKYCGEFLIKILLADMLVIVNLILIIKEIRKSIRLQIKKEMQYQFRKKLEEKQKDELTRIDKFLEFYSI